MNKIKYCVWVRQRNYSTLFLWRYCEFLESARYYAGVARDKETSLNLYMGKIKSLSREVIKYGQDSQVRIYYITLG